MDWSNFVVWLLLGNNPTIKLDQSICCDTKRNPTTPNSNESKDRNSQHKKTRREVGGEQAKFDKKAMGLFHISNPDINSSAVFPRDLAQKVCVDFTCKGKECIRENCTHLHPCQARDLDRARVEAIGHHFATTKQGWLSEYHFCREELPANVLAMLGGLKGPSNSKRN